MIQTDVATTIAKQSAIHVDTGQISNNILRYFRQMIDMAKWHTENGNITKYKNIYSNNNNIQNI